MMKKSDTSLLLLVHEYLKDHDSKSVRKVSKKLKSSLADEDLLTNDQETGGDLGKTNVSLRDIWQMYLEGLERMKREEEANGIANTEKPAASGQTSDGETTSGSVDNDEKRKKRRKDAKETSKITKSDESREDKSDSATSKKTKKSKKVKTSDEIKLSAKSNSSEESSDAGLKALDKSAKKKKKKDKKNEPTESPSLESEAEPKKSAIDTNGAQTKVSGKRKRDEDATADENVDLENAEQARKKKREMKQSMGRFCRIDVEKEISGLKDKRLLDNTYVGTFGEKGWGFKAQKVLGTVKGKDFRAEKNKKKRGGYRGGAIDLGAVNSIPLESDAE